MISQAACARQGNAALQGFPSEPLARLGNRFLLQRAWLAARRWFFRSRHLPEGDGASVTACADRRRFRQAHAFAPWWDERAGSVESLLVPCRWSRKRSRAVPSYVAV